MSFSFSREHFHPAFRHGAVATLPAKAPCVFSFPLGMWDNAPEGRCTGTLTDWHGGMLPSSHRLPITHPSPIDPSLFAAHRSVLPPLRSPSTRPTGASAWEGRHGADCSRIHWGPEFALHHQQPTGALCQLLQYCSEVSRGSCTSGPPLRSAQSQSPEGRPPRALIRS